jgi:hypothetical protein
MYHKDMGSYDEIPEGMKVYLNNYGCHFNKKLYHEAVSRMYKKTGGRKEYLTPMSKDEVDSVLENYGIDLERGKLYDAAYVMMMCKADFYGKSVPNEECLAKYVKDVIDDADAVDGYVFNRFYADTMFMNEPIEWEDVI